MLGPYTKAIIALILSAATAVAAAVGNGSLDDLDTEGWVKVALVVVGGSAATWFAANGPAAPKVKAFLAGVTAGLTGWTVAYENDHVVTQGEWLTLAVAAVAAFTAAYQLSNDPQPADG